MSGPTNSGGNLNDPGSQQGYPQYPQQPQPLYSQPPAYPPPYAQPPGTPPKKRRAGRVVLIIGIIAAVLIVGCLGAAVFVSTVLFKVANGVVNLNPNVAVVGFCQDETSQDYTYAYTQLSHSLQQQYSKSRFIQDGHQHDRTLGPITYCLAQGLPNIDNTNATTTVKVTRTLAPTPDSSGSAPPKQTTSETGQMTLVQNSSGSWLVNSVDPSLDML